VFLSSGAYIGNKQLWGSDAIATVKISRELVHPNFDPVTLENDILLLQLSKPLNGVVPIAKINKNRTIPAAGSTVRTIGFGTTSESGKLSQVLQQVDIRVVDQAKCRATFASTHDTIADSMLCAIDSNKDACQGDSGSPLLQLDGTLVGLVSWGIGCARGPYPGVYTRMSSHTSFIENGICTMSASKPSTCPSPPAASTIPALKSSSRPCSIGEICYNTGVGYNMQRVSSNGHCIDMCVTRMFAAWKFLGFDCGTCPT
jgi:secreted trypsin-like serine protease